MKVRKLVFQLSGIAFGAALYASSQFVCYAAPIFDLALTPTTVNTDGIKDLSIDAKLQNISSSSFTFSSVIGFGFFSDTLIGQWNALPGQSFGPGPYKLVDNFDNIFSTLSGLTMTPGQSVNFSFGSLSPIAPPVASGNYSSRFSLIYQSGGVAADQPFSVIVMPSFNDIIQNAVHIYPFAGTPPNNWTSFRDRYGLVGKYPAAWSSYLSTGIGATFIPNGNVPLQQAAALGGFDHFNWVQGFSSSPTGALTLDPSVTGCNQGIADLTGRPCPPANRDTLPWYLDEQYTTDGIQVYDANHNRVTGDPTLQTRLEAWNADPNTLLFSDSPNQPSYFTTCLVGVRSNGTGSLLSPSDCFFWDTATGPPSPIFGQFEGPGPNGLATNFDGFFDPTDPADVLRFAELQSALTTVPEPSELSILMAGLLSLTAVRIFRRGNRIV